MSDEKNILGMNMTEWRNLSGLADPYALDEAITARTVGRSKAEIQATSGSSPAAPSGDDKKKSQADAIKAFVATHGIKRVTGAGRSHSDEMNRHKPGHLRRLAATRAAQAKEKKAKREQEKAAAAREKENQKFGGRAAEVKSQYTPAQQDRIARQLAAKRELTTDLELEDIDVLWASFLEDRGSSVEEYNYFVDLAVESGDEELAIELIAVEDQFDEVLATTGAPTKAPMAAGGQPAGMPAKPPMQKAPMAAGGGQPAGAPPAAGGTAAPAGASAPAVPAAPAQAAVPAQAPTQSAGASPVRASAPQMTKEQPGLLGAIAQGVKGVGQVARGTTRMVGSSMRGVGQVPQQNASVDYSDEFEAILSEEFGITAEQYVALCDDAFESGDEDMIDAIYQVEGIMDKLFGRNRQTHEKNMEVVRQAVSSINKVGGLDKSKKIARHGYGIPTAKVDKPKAKAGSGTTLNQSADEGDVALQIMESSGAFAPREKSSDLQALISCQLQYSGYEDEYIEARTKVDQERALARLAPGIRRRDTDTGSEHKRAQRAAISVGGSATREGDRLSKKVDPASGETTPLQRLHGQKMGTDPRSVPKSGFAGLRSRS